MIDTILTLDYIISAVLLTLLIITALAIAFNKDLLTNTIMLSIFSLLMAALYLTLSAPDVAITEAAVGAGISTILFLAALILVGSKEKKEQGNLIVPVLVVLITTIALLYIASILPPFGDANNVIHQHLVPYYLTQSEKDIGIPNVVTSILASYRGFDTLGEVFVIFTAATSVLLLLGDDLKKLLKKRS